MRDRQRQEDRDNHRETDRHRETERDRQTEEYRTRGQDGNNQTLNEKKKKKPTAYRE